MKLYKQIEEKGGNPPPLIINNTDVELLNSTYLANIIRFEKGIKNPPLVLIVDSQENKLHQQMYEITRFNKIFEFYNNVPEALGSLNRESINLPYATIDLTVNPHETLSLSPFRKSA